MKQTFFKGFTIDNISQKPIEVDNKAGRISSDGGLLLFSSLDNKFKITKKISECMEDKRQKGKVDHSTQNLLKQRILGLQAGYSDQNDHTQLRKDDILKVCLGRERDLGSQSTMSRFENNATVKEIIKISYKLVEQFVQQYKKAPKRITIDIDPTDTETHGNQQGALFHGFYMQYQYYPLLVFCKGTCIGAMLRKGTVSASKYAPSMLRRIIERIREYWPGVKIKLRGDCGFGNPKMYRFCELNGIEYIFGIATNEVLKREVKDLYCEVEKDYEETQEKVTRYKSFYYQAGSWEKQRLVVAKVEHTGIGMNMRYIVISDASEFLTEKEAKRAYKEYIRRGAMEVDIGEWKNALNSDRMSCPKFTANWFRLLLHTVAYNLMVLVKRLSKGKIQEIAGGSLQTMRIYLIKIGAMVRKLKTRIKIHLSSSFPHLNIFERVAELLL